MKGRLLPLGALIVAMLLTAIASYLTVAAQATSTTTLVKLPTQTAPRSPAADLHGNLYFVQSGAIYRLASAHFDQLTPREGWTQVTAMPGGGLLAVKRVGFYSDVYRLDAAGHVSAQLTHNAASAHADPGAYHWSFYPQATPDGGSIFMSYDSVKELAYQVDLAIWQMPISGTRSQWRQWTFPNDYTGGDIQPLPLASGAILYVGFDQDQNGHKAAQIFYLPRRLAQPVALTKLTDDCSQPALSPDGGSLAMICTYEKESSQLVLASFDGKAISGQRVVATTAFVTEPAWAPDGSGIAYLAPAVANHPFQLWWLPKAAYEAPSPSPSPSLSPVPGLRSTPSARPAPPPKPVQVTTDLAIDATSPIGWAA